MKRTFITPTDREVILLGRTCSAPEARFLCESYYAAQDMRKALDMQLRHLGERDDVIADQKLGPLLTYATNSFATIEGQIGKAMEAFASEHKVGLWMMAQHGVGPVLAAGFLAHLDITKAPTAGHFWSFAGLGDPNKKWEKGQKRPYNAALKQLCWHLGECIKRTHNSEQSFYGPIYRSMKARIVQKNENGENAERAKTFRTNSAEVRKKLKQGKLPDGNLDRQACRNVAKIFLSHLHAVMYWDHFGKIPPKPFAMVILGHAHEVRVPGTEEQFPGFSEAYYGSAWKQAAE